MLPAAWRRGLLGGAGRVRGAGCVVAPALLSRGGAGRVADNLTSAVCSGQVMFVMSDVDGVCTYIPRMVSVQSAKLLWQRARVFVTPLSMR